MLALLLLALTQAPAVGAQKGDEVSLLRQIVPQPTGANGYEEYLAAADIAKAGEYEAYERLRTRLDQVRSGQRTADQLGNPPAGVDLEATELDIARETSRRFGKAFELLRAGNRKPVADPRRQFELLGWREYGHFFQLVKIARDRAYVSFADGLGAEGTETLLQGLVFADNVAGSSIYGHSAGSRSHTFLMRAFEENRPRFSLRDAERIVAVCDGLLGRPSTWARVLRWGQTVEATLPQQILENPEKYAEYVKPYFRDPKENEGRVALLKALLPSHRAQAEAVVRRGIVDRYARLLKIAQGPEADWIGAAEAESTEFVGAGSDPIVTAMEGLFAPGVREDLDLGGGDTGGRAAIMRTQIRLLRLHAKIVAYRWTHNRLPTKLEEVGNADDPLAGGQFVYELDDKGGYRLTSKGAKGTGEIDLLYRPSGVSGPEVSPPFVR